jgi:putative transposase
MEEVKQEYQSLSHSKWDCKYHVVFIPKRRRRALFRQVRRHLGKIFHALASRKNARFRKGICFRIMFICVSRFPRNTRWHRW